MVEVLRIVLISHFWGRRVSDVFRPKQTINVTLALIKRKGKIGKKAIVLSDVNFMKAKSQSNRFCSV